MKKINYSMVARSLIALLFVVAGIQKLMNFQEASASVAAIGVPFATLATIIVIIIEVPLAIMFAIGKHVNKTGWALIGFTVLATEIVHGKIDQGMNLIMALKNISIIGGIMLAMKDCGCVKCGKACEECKVS
mgnify:FL=1